MERIKLRATSRMDALFQTGYPHPINLFASLMLTFLPLLSPFTGESPSAIRFSWHYWVAGAVAGGYLLVWSRLRVFRPERSSGFYQGYLLAQTVAVSLIYALDGGLTRFLFVVVSVQAVYITPVRRWAPFLGTLAVLWLTLYLVLSQGGPEASQVSTIGMYLCYLIFAALVTFTTVQQERQNTVAQELLDGVDRRHHTLRVMDQTVEKRSELEERERLAQTICAALLTSLASLLHRVDELRTGKVPFARMAARTARLQAKEVLSAVRQAVRTLRPGEDGDEPGQASELFEAPPEPEIAMKWTDPIRVYHVWNVGVIVLTIGVMVASSLVAGTDRWLPLSGLGVGLLGAYGGTASFRQPWIRNFWLVAQAGLIIGLVMLSREPLMNHLFLMVAAQMVFWVPPVTRRLVAAVIFPTLLSGVALWTTGLFPDRVGLLISATAAFGVTNFFGAVMAFMTRRQVDARQRAVIYASQLAEVNRLLETKVQEVRHVAIARERVRMAREIHDGLGHHLTIVIVELQYAEELAEEEPTVARQHADSAAGIIQTAMDASREIVESLERFERPIGLALQELVIAWQKGNTARVALRVQGDFSALSTAARITLYRAVQESLTNIQKHAGAARVVINLTQTPGKVTLHVANDDTGASPPMEAGQGGFGLVGLKERTELLGGEFWAGTRSDGGYQVRVVLPMGV